MIARIRTCLYRLAGWIKDIGKKVRKALKRAGKQHHQLLASDPAYRHYLRITAAVLLRLSGVPAALAPLLLAVLDQYTTPADPGWDLITLND